MKLKSLIVSFSALIILFSVMLCSCTPFEMIAKPPKNTFEYSPETLFSQFEYAAKIKSPENRVFFKKNNGEVTQKNVDDTLDKLYDKSAYFYYYIKNVTYTLTDLAVYYRLEYTLEFTPETVNSDEIIPVENQNDAVDKTLKQINSEINKMVFMIKDTSFNNETAKIIANTAQANAPIAYLFDSYSFCYYPEDADIRFLELEFVTDIDEKETAKLNTELNEKVDKIAEKIKNRKLNDPKKIYRAVHDEVIESTEYDYDLPKKNSGSDKENIARSAYGCLVQEKTVCSGYAAAFKAICDKLGLDCWSVIGSYKKDGHEWNAVKIDGKRYYIDCTFDDTSKCDDFFMFDENDNEFDGYDIDDYFIMPW